MVAVVKLIANISFFIYLVLAIIGIFILGLIRVAVKERSQSIFDLERNQVTAKINAYLSYLFFLFLIAVGTFYTATVVYDSLPIPVETPTPTAAFTLPPTPTSVPLLHTPTPTLTPTPRPTIIFEVTETPPPAAAVAGAPPNCPVPGAHITQPGDGATVSGVTAIFGAASVDNFDYYKIEFRVPGLEEWSFIESFSTPAGEGLLATWNTNTVPPGNYDFRLVVVDKTGNFPKPCQIRLRVER
jgi:hypothetical protein